MKSRKKQGLAIRTIVLSLLYLVVQFEVLAQDEPKQREIGFSFSDLDDFGVTYRVGQKESLWRYSILDISGENRKFSYDFGEQTESNHELNIAFGKEYRINILKNLEFRYGVDIGFGFEYFRSVNVSDEPSIPDQIFTNVTYSPSLNPVIGLNLMISDRLILGVEVLPSIRYNIVNSRGEDFFTSFDGEQNSSFEYSLSTSSTLLSLMYRFN